MTKDELREKERFSIEDLFAIVSILRGENGCPWDRAQTHESLKKNLIEEAWEVVEGIERSDPKLLCEELGDLLLQIVFHCSLAEDAGEFSAEDVSTGICRKMIRRHPHVFSDQSISESEIQNNWSEIKKREKGAKTPFEVLDSVAKTLPGLMRAEKFIEKRKKEGLEPLPAIADLTEKEAFGERIYALVSEGTSLGFSAEDALRAYLAKNLTNSTKK